MEIRSNKASAQVMTAKASQDPRITSEDSFSLLEWVAPNDAVHLVLSTIESATTGSLPVRFYNQHGESYQVKALLAILTYAYATGLYGSRRIAEVLPDEPNLRYLATSTWVDWLSLKQFRRQHLRELQGCLVHLFKLAWVYRFTQSRDVGSIDRDVLESFLQQDWFHPEIADRFERLAELQVRHAMARDTADLDD